MIKMGQEKLRDRDNILLREKNFYLYPPATNMPFIGYLVKTDNGFDLESSQDVTIPISEDNSKNLTRITHPERVLEELEADIEFMRNRLN
ncbi:hypothetical protein GOV13_00305 [Candidatus Pacearchaeota archaeon]|nr:hypothetical protein [Candidatus Pacearchaeota archaeon]